MLAHAARIKGFLKSDERRGVMVVEYEFGLVFAWVESIRAQHEAEFIKALSFMTSISALMHDRPFLSPPCSPFRWHALATIHTRDVHSHLETL